MIEYYKSNNIYLDVPIYDKKAVNNEANEINHLISAKSCEFLSKDNNDLLNSYNKNSTSIFKLNENSKLIGNNKKNSLINKKNGLGGEKFIQNYIESDVQKLSNNTISKNIGLIRIPIKKTKLALLESNKNLSLLKTQIQSRNNEKRINKFFFNDYKDGKILYNSKGNKIIDSTENNNKRLCYSQKNTKENDYNKVINGGKRLRNNKTAQETFPSIGNNNDINSLKLMNNATKVNSKDININIKKDNSAIAILKKNISQKNIAFNNRYNNKTLKSLTTREKAFYLLSQSTVLRLCERIIFSRTTEKVKNLISIKDILKSNEIFIKDKIKELEEKMINYNLIIEKPFSPSKTSIISLNLIMKEDEDEFKNLFSKNYIDDEIEKYYYDIYIELLFILLGEDYNKNFGVKELYDKLHQKGFVNFKDYLYQLFILQKFKKELFNENKIDKFLDLFEKLPNLIKYEGDIKTNRFICFSSFILTEANSYWRKFKEYIQLKNKTHHYIEGLRKKISLKTI